MQTMADTTTKTMDRDSRTAHTWLWAGTLFFAKGVMFAAITVTALIMDVRLGMDAGWAALSTSALMLVVAARPLFARWICRVGRMKRWVVASQLVFAWTMMEVAACASSSSWKTGVWSWLLLASVAWAVHGTATDEVCLRMRRRMARQTWVYACCVYAVAVMLTSGLTLMVAGNAEVLTVGNVEVIGPVQLGRAWAMAFKVAAAMMGLCLALTLVALPGNDSTRVAPASVLPMWRTVVARWMGDREAWMLTAMAVLLLAAKGLLLRGMPLFVTGAANVGGLALGPQEAAFALYTVGMTALVFGIALSEKIVRCDTPRQWLWWAVATLVAPGVLPVYLAFSMNADLLVVCGCLFVEQLSCGLGMMALARWVVGFCRHGNVYRRAGTAMALGTVAVAVAGGLTGALQEYLGYRRFFALALALGMAAATLLAWLTRQGDTDDDD